MSSGYYISCWTTISVAVTFVCTKATQTKSSIYCTREHSETYSDSDDHLRQWLVVSSPLPCEMIHQQLQIQCLKRSVLFVSHAVNWLAWTIFPCHMEEELWLKGVTVQTDHQGNSQCSDFARYISIILIEMKSLCARMCVTLKAGWINQRLNSGN